MFEVNNLENNIVNYRDFKADEGAYGPKDQTDYSKAVNADQFFSGLEKNGEKKQLGSIKLNTNKLTTQKSLNTTNTPFNADPIIAKPESALSSNKSYEQKAYKQSPQLE